MARSKQNKNKNTKDKDGKHRKETKEERKERLAAEQKAREGCFKVLPYAGGAIVLFMILFGIYVRSVPPAEPKLDNSQPQFQGSVPDFMNVDTEPMVKEALDEAAEVLKNLEKEGGEGEAPPQGENVETIEL